MAKVKTSYSYWELPEWKEQEVLVLNIAEKNDKTYITLVLDNHIYRIKKPKLGAWDKVKAGDVVKITKNAYGYKNARLTLEL